MSNTPPPHPGPDDARRDEQRLRRIEELAGFNEHTCEQLSQEIAEINRRLAALSRRLDALVARLEAVEQTEPPEDDDAQP